MTRRARDGAAILPVIALVLFMPPFIQALDFGATVFGLPLLLLALTAYWVIGILLTALVSRRLAREMGDAADVRPDPSAPDGR